MKFLFMLDGRNRKAATPFLSSEGVTHPAPKRAIFVDLDFISDFIKAMSASDCTPADISQIQPTEGQWKRFQLAGDPKNKTVGYYRLTIDDGFAVGNFGNRRIGETHTWTSKSDKEWTEEEKEAWKERVRQQKKRAERDLEDGWNKAKIEANDRWNKASGASESHPYLLAKKIPPHGMKQEGDNIIIPAFGADNFVWNIQEIRPDGQKRWLFGGKKKGTFYPFVKKEDSRDTIIICEGFATGKSIRMATGHPVLAAWDTGNLIEVAKIAKKKYPKAVIIIACDNDQFTNGNPGITKGKEAADKVKGYAIWPEFEDSETKPTDFNDAYNLRGSEYVKRRIEEVKPKQEGVLPDTAIAKINESNKTEINTDWMDLAKWANVSYGHYDPKYAVHNANIILTHAPNIGGHIVLDEFSGKEVVIKPMPWDDPKEFQVRNFSEVDLIEMRAWLELKELKLQKSATKDAVKVAAQKHKINPAKEYLETLKWDGKPRLNNWLTYYLGAEKQPKEYLERVGSCWLIAAAKRIYEPGTPFHHMLVLEGGQAAGKSSALKNIATFGREKPVAYFSDRVTFEHIDKKEFAEFAAGHVVLEFQELSGLGKKDRNKVKQWLTQDSDEYKRPFDTITTVYPRRFVVAGTTNDAQYLTDPTGDRRFWPVTVGEHIDAKALAQDREQIWAETTHRYKQGELWFIPADDPVYRFMQNEQSARYIGDPWEQVICDALDFRQTVTIDEIFKDFLNIPKERWDRGARSRITDILIYAGWENKTTRVGGRVQRMWVKKEKKGTQEELLG